MELVDGGANRTDLCELLAMREYELDNLRERYERLHRAVEGAMRELTREVVR